MPLKGAYLVIIQEISYDRIANAIEFGIGIVSLLKLVIGLFDAQHIQGINILPGNYDLFRKLHLRFYGHCFQDTARGCYAYLMQLFSGLLLQILFNLGNRPSYHLYVVDLPVKHGSGLVLSYTLCHHMKDIPRHVAHGPHKASCAYVQPEYKLSRISLFFAHCLTPIIVFVLFLFAARSAPFR